MPLIWQSHGVSILLVFSTTALTFFIAQNSMLRQELRVARGLPASRPSQVQPRIERPRKVGNLQAAMGLENNYTKFHQFQASLFRLLLAEHAVTESYILQCDAGDFALRVGLDYRIHWPNQDMKKVTEVATMVRAFPF